MSSPGSRGASRSCNCSRQDKPLGRVASPEAIDHITRNTAREMGEYRKLAKALIAGKTGDNNS